MTVDTTEVAIEEGATARVVFTATPPPSQPLTVNFSVGVDDDAATPDASSADYNAPGSVVVGAGEAAATVEITITDDERVEPTREVLQVTLSPDAGYEIGEPNIARVTIHEGVCDRTPKIQERITGHSGVPDQCADVSDEHLGLVTGAFDLTTNGDLSSTLKAGDFGGLVNVASLKIENQSALTHFEQGALSGLTGAETIELQDNDGLTELPGHLFEGLGTTLRTVLIYENANLATLSEDLFQPVAGLTRLQLDRNALTRLPANLFRGLTALNLGGEDYDSDNLGRGLDLKNNRISDLPAGVFSDLDALEALDLTGNPLGTLSPGLFAGLDSLRGLGLWVVHARNPDRALEVQDGAFDDLDRLEFLNLGGNRLTTLPSGILSDLGNLGHLRLHRNQFETLPEGIFLGLVNLYRVSGNIHEDARNFDLTPQFQRVADLGSGVFTANLVLLEGAPFEMPITLSTSNGTVSDAVVTLSRGTTQTRVVTVTQTGGPPAELTMDVPDPPGSVTIGDKGCSSNCFERLRTDEGSPFTFADHIGPRLAGVVFRSTPVAGDAYSTQARETILIAVRFDEDVVISGGTPVFTLDVGGTPRDAVYASELSAPAELVFAYPLASDDQDDDGVGFAADALKPSGATLADSLGNAAETALDAYAVANDPDRKVAGQVLALRFEPDNLTLLTGQSGTVELILDGAARLAAGEEVTVTFTTDPVMSPLFTTLPPSLTLSAAHPTTMVTIGAGSEGGDAVVEARIAPVADVRLVAGRLAVRVTRPVITITTPEVSAAEGAVAEITAVISPAPAEEFSVSLSFTELPEEAFPAVLADTDSIAAVTIGAGQSVATFAVPIFDDELVEPTREVFDVTIVANPSAFTIGEQSTARVTILEGVCDRTPKIQERITGHSAVPDQCADVTDEHLGLVTGAFELTNSNDLPDGLKAGDFDGLVNVTRLKIENQGASLDGFEQGTLSGLTGAETIELQDNAGLTELPGHLFEGLGAALRKVLIHENANLTTLSETLFRPVPGLTRIKMNNNALTHLPVGLFQGLTSLNLGGEDFISENTVQGLDLGNNNLGSLPAGVFSDLGALEALELTNNQVETLPAGVFRGLDSLRDLGLWNVVASGQALDVEAGAFDGLGRLEFLQLGGNGLTTLPPGVFSDLGNLGHLRLQLNAFTDLPRGIFLGLRNLHKVSGDIGGDRNFTLTPEFQHVADTGPGTFTARLTLFEGAPFEMPVMISVAGGRASSGTDTVSVVTLSRGTTQTEVFTVTQTAKPSVALTMDVPAPPGSVTIDRVDKCDSDCFVRLRTADGSALTLDKLGPRPTGVAFRSMPASGDSYSARSRETVSVAVNFDEDVVVQGGAPVFTLDVGGTPRDAVYVPELSTPAGLVFNHQLAADDLDDDGIGFAADALKANGASLADSAGNAVLASLTAYAVANDPGHKVTALILTLRFEPAELALLPGQSGAVELIADGGALLASGEEVAVAFTTDPVMSPLFTTSPPSPTLSAARPATTVTVEAGSQEGEAVLQAQGTGPANVQIIPTSLPVRVSPPVITIATPEVAAEEGATARVVFAASPAPPSPVTVSFSVGADSGADTPDASDSDYNVFGDVLDAGVVVGAGESAATIEITITDDDLVEPPREVLEVTLLSGVGYEISQPTTARVAIKEGVCDRTPTIRDKIAMDSGVSGQCAEVTDAHLGSLSGDFNLTSSDSLPSTLKAGDFGGLVNVAAVEIASQGRLNHFERGALAGLTGAETIELRNNSGLTELPGDLFEGLGTALRKVLIYDNSNLTTLSETLFDPVAGLTLLRLDNNGLTHLPAGLFRGLTSLNLGGETLDLTVERPRTDQGLRLDRNAGITEIPAGIFSDLTSLEALTLERLSVPSLSRGTFRGLDNLRALSLWDLRREGESPLELVRGTFEGLGNLEFLNLGFNSLSTLPSGVFSELGNLGHLRLQSNQFETLPEGIFLGLGNLYRVSGDIGGDGRDFTLTPQFRHVADVSPGVFTARVTLREGAPFKMPVTLSTSNGTLSTDVVTLSRGATQTEIFTVTQTGVPPAEVTMEVPNPPGSVTIGGKGCASNCFEKFLTAAGSALVLDKRGPRPTGVAFRSMPASGDAYSSQSRETVSIAVNFDEAVVVQGGTPVFTLDVGGTPHDAAYVPELSTPAGLVFNYRLAADDSDDDGIGFAADALKANGATLADSVGNAAETELGAYAVANDPGHKVVGRVVTLRFEPAELALLPGSSGMVELIAAGAELLTPDEVVTVTLTTDALLEGLLQRRTLSAAHPAMMITVIAQMQEGTGILQMQGEGPANLRVIPASLSVRVTRPVITIATPEVSAAEGAIARVVFAATPPPTQPLTVNFSTGADADPDTPDASGSDYSVAAGNVVVGTDAPAATLDVTITDDDLIEPTREVLQVTLLSGADYEIGEPATAKVVIKEGVCDRTPTIRDKIAADSGVPGQCAEVTDERLGLLTGAFELTTADSLPATLKDGDFDGLVNVAGLNIQNQGTLNGFEQGALAGLTGAEAITLSNNPGLTGLPGDLFEGLASNLQEVFIEHNANLTTLAPEIFRLLANLGRIEMQGNNLSALPEGVFEGLGNLYRARFHDNPGAPFTLRPQFERVADVSPGVFTARLRLREGAPFEMRIRLSTAHSTVSGGVVTLSRGATQSEVFTVTQTGNPPVELSMTVPNPPDSVVIAGETKCFTGTGCFLGLSTANGDSYTSDDISPSLVRMATTEAAVVEGETARIVITATPPPVRDFTVNYRVGVDDDADTPDASALDYHAPGSVVVAAGETAATIEITITDDDLPESLLEEVFVVTLSPDVNYELGTPTTATLTIRDGICDRTRQVRDKLLQTLAEGMAGGVDCVDVTGEDLAGFSGELNLESTNISSLKPGDFRGLTGLGKLDLEGNQLQELPAGVFGDLGRVRELVLINNRLTTLTSGVFAGLSALETLRLGRNRLADLPADLLDGLGALRVLILGGNALTGLADGFFSGPTGLTNLLMDGNDLRSLPDEVFFDLRNLQNLSLHSNELSELPEGAFSNYRGLISLRLNGNQFAELPAGGFPDLESLDWLALHDNQFAELPAGVFAGLGRSTGAKRLTVLSLGGRNPGAPFELALGLEFERHAGAAAARSATLRATLREGAPYHLEFGLQAAGGELSSTELVIPAGATRSETFVVTRADDASSVAVSFTEPSPAPTACTSWKRFGGVCFSGFTIGFSARFTSGDAAPEAGVVSIISSPASGDAYAAGSGEEIVLEVEFGGQVAAIPAADGSLPTLEMEIGAATRTAVYDAAASSSNGLVFRYTPVRGDYDDDGVSVRADALKLNGARIAYLADDPAADLNSPRNDPDNDGYAVRNAAGHRVESAGHALQFEPAELALTPGSSGTVVLRVGDVEFLPAGAEIAVTFTTDPMTDPPFTATPARMTLSAEDSTLMVTIEVEETRAEETGILEARGASPSDARFIPARLTVRVVLPVITMTATEVAVVEGATAGIPVGIHPPPGRTFDLHYNAHPVVVAATLAPGTVAASDGDIGAGDRVAIQPGQTAATLTVAVVDDNLAEPTRAAFDVVVATRTAFYRRGDPSSARVTIQEGVCDRTDVIRDMITNHASVPDQCAEVTDEHLGLVTGDFNLTDANSLPASLKAGDFAGLVNVAAVEIANQANLNHFPRGTLSGLTGAETIELRGSSGLTELPGYLFEGLGTTLRKVLIHDNSRLTTLSETLFHPLPDLTRLRLDRNALTHLPADLFKGLTNLNLGGATLDLTPVRPDVGLGLDFGLNLGIMEIPAGIFSDLTSLESLSLGDISVPSLPPGIFRGLDNLRALNLWNVIPRPAGADLVPLEFSRETFEGLDRLEFLNLGNNALTTVPPGAFSELGNLGHLRLRSNAFPGTTLPAGIFSGLVNLYRVSGGFRGEVNFTLTPRFERVADVSPGVFTARLTLLEGAPFEMPVMLSASGGTLSTDVVTLFRGTTQSEVFSVTQAAGPPVALTMNVPNTPSGAVTIGDEQKCSSRCFDNLRTAAGDALVSDAIGPQPVGAAFRSTPAIGGIYNARAQETISVAVRFDEGVVFRRGTGSTLVFTLDVGGVEREAAYVPELSAPSNTPAELVFHYRLVSADLDDDGIGFAADALDLKGGSLADASGNAAGTALDAYAVVDDPDRKVAELVLALRFEPDEIMLQRRQSFQTRLILEGAETLNPGEVVSVAVPNGATFETSPRTLSLSAANPAEAVTVTAPLDAALGDESVDAEGVLTGAEVLSGRLAVSVLRRELEVVFSPDRLTLLRGGVAAATASGTVMVETRPELLGNEVIALELSAPAGIGLSPPATVLSSVNQTAAVEVTAGAAAGYESLVSASTTAETRLGAAVLRLGEATVSALRSVDLRFHWRGAPETPLSIPIGSAESITISAAPPLEGDERVGLTPTLDFAAFTSLSAEHIALELTPAQNSRNTRFTATAAGVSGRVSFGTSGHRVHVASEPFSLEVETTVHRVVSLRFVPPTLQVMHGRSADFTVTTVPPLDLGQSARVGLMIDGGLTRWNPEIRVGSVSTRVATISQANPSRVVTLSAPTSAPVGTSGRIRMDPALLTLNGVEFDPALPELAVEVTPLRVAAAFDPAELDLEVGVAQDIEIGVGAGELAPGQSLELRVNAEAAAGLGLTINPAVVRLTPEASTATLAVTASRDGVEGRVPVEAAPGAVALAGDASFQVRVRHIIRLQFDPPEVAVVAGQSTRVQVSFNQTTGLSGAWRVDINNNAFGLPGVRFPSFNLTRAASSRTFTLNVERDAPPSRAVLEIFVRSSDAQGFPQVRFIPAELPVTVLQRVHRVAFDPPSVVLVRGGVAGETASTEVWIAPTPVFEGNERVAVEVIPIAGFSASPDLATINANSSTRVRVTIGAGARTGGEGFVFLRESSSGDLDTARVELGRLETRVVRGVELTLAREGDTAPVEVGAAATFALSTDPPLIAGERVTARLRSPDDAWVVGGEPVVLHGARPRATFSATPQVPGVTGRIVASGVGEGVAVVARAALDVATTNVNLVSLLFDPPSVRFARETSTEVKIATRPLLGSGQSLSATLTAESESGGVTLGASSQDAGAPTREIELRGDTASSRVATVWVSASPQARAGSGASVAVVPGSVSLSGVNLEEPLPVLAVEVTTPRAEVVELIPAEASDQAAGALRLAPGRLGRVSVVVRSSVTATLQFEVEGEGLTVFPAQRVVTPGITGEVLEVSAAAADVVGVLSVSAVGAVDLSGPTTLPVRVANRLLFDPALLRVMKRESTRVMVTLESTRSLSVGEQVEVDLSSLNSIERFTWSPSVVTFSAARPTTVVSVTVAANSFADAEERPRRLDLPVAAFESGRLVGDVTVEILNRAFDVVFEPELLTIVRGGAAPTTVSATATVKTVPRLRSSPTATNPDDRREIVGVELQYSAGGPDDSVSPTSVTLTPENPVAQITVTVTSDSGGVVTSSDIFEVSNQDAVTNDHALDVEIVRSVELRFAGIPRSSAGPLEMTVGETTRLTVTAEPALQSGEAIDLRLDSANGALRFNPQTQALVYGVSEWPFDVTAIAPDVMERLTVSATGRGVVLAGGDLSAAVTVGQAATVSVTFDRGYTFIGQNRSTVVRVGVAPALGAGQSVSVTASVHNAPPGVTVTPEQFMLDQTTQSQELTIFMPLAATIDEQYEVRLAADGTGVAADVPDNLTIEAAWARIGLELSHPDGLVLKDSANVTITVAAGDLVAGQSEPVIFDLYLEVAGLSVRSGDSSHPQRLSFTSDQLSTAVTITASERARGVLGELEVRSRDWVNRDDESALREHVRLPIRVFSVSVEAAEISAPEGETVDAAVLVTPAPAVPLRVGYAVGVPPGENVPPDTADASDYRIVPGAASGESPGELIIPAGETRAVVAVEITDDDEIEPPRERFSVRLAESLSYHVSLSSSTIRVLINEGVCDRTPQVRDAITSAVSADSCEDVTAGLLGPLAGLFIHDAGLSALKAGDFSGLTGLISLNLRGSALSRLPPGIFADVAQLHTLDLSDNRFTDLPAGTFVGLGGDGLTFLNMRENRGSTFTLTVAPRRLNSPPAQPAEFRLVVGPGAPFTMEIGVSALEGTVSPERVTIPAGSTESGVFSVTLDQDSSRAEVVFENPQTPSSCETGPPCYRGVEVALDTGVENASSASVLVLDNAAPELTGVEILSMPVGQTHVPFSADRLVVYAPGETIVAALRFSEGIVVLSGPESGPDSDSGLPGLKLRIGSEDRVATYAAALSATDTLVFHYTVADGDKDTNGIQILADALVFNGAQIRDYSGLVLDPSLGEARSFPDHKVAQLFSVVLNPPTVEVEPGRTTTFTVTTRPPLPNADRSVSFFMNPGIAESLGLKFAPSGPGGTLHVALNGGTANRALVASVSAASTAVAGAVVTLDYLTSIQGSGVPFVQTTSDDRLRLPPPRLSVTVVVPKATVAFSPADELFLTPGAAGEVRVGFAPGDVAPATLSVEADGGFSVSASRLSLGGNAPSSATVTVTAPTATSATGVLRVQAEGGVELRQAAELPLRSGREFALLFEPVSLALTSGETTQVRISLDTESGGASPLGEDEVVYVAFTPDPGLGLPGPPVLLDAKSSSAIVAIKALLSEPPGESSVTARVSQAQAQYLAARFDDSTLPVSRLLREIRLLFEPGAVILEREPNTNEASIDARVTTDKPLLENEVVAVRLVTRDRDGRPIDLTEAGVTPSLIELLPQSGSQEITVFSSTRNIARVQAQRLGETEIGHAMLHIGHLDVTFKAGVRLRVRVFLEGALE